MALSVYTPTGIIHETSVDFTKRVLTEPVHLVQYDESLPVVAVTCLDAGQYMTLTALDTVSIRMDKGDGTFIYNPALGMSADGHIVYIQITLQMTANYGRFEPVIELLRDGGYGASSPIPLFIDANPVPNEAIQSTSQWESLNDIVARANAIVAGDAVEFTEAETRENINSGENLITMFGKIKKWFSSVANNLTTPAAGQAVLDAYQGKLLNDKISYLAVSGYRLYDARNGDVEYGKWNSIGSVTIPAGDTHVWLVFSMSNDSIAADHMAAMKLISTPTTGTILGEGKFEGRNGALMNCWGFVVPGADVARTITPQIYGYQSTTYSAYARILAIAITDTRVS